MELQVYPDRPGVYFLVKEDSVVYVGQTKSLRNIWSGSRHRDKPHDRLFYIECVLKDAKALEGACIAYFKPRHNKMITVNKASDTLVESVLRGSPLLRMRGVKPNIEGPFTYEYPRPSVTVDGVVFGYDENDQEDPLQLLLIRRNGAPFIGRWALPGGFVEVSDHGGQGEDLDVAARREIQEETQLAVSHLEQLYTFGTPQRDPRGRVISVAYLALVRKCEYSPIGGSDASEAKWVGVKRLFHPQAFKGIEEQRKEYLGLWVEKEGQGLQPQFAFDHERVIRMALDRLRGKIVYSPVGLNLMPPKFTLAELRGLYESILGGKIDASNFSKRILATDILVALDERESGGGRPATVFRFDEEKYQRAADNGGLFNLNISVTKT